MLITSRIKSSSNVQVSTSDWQQGYSRWSFRQFFIDMKRNLKFRMKSGPAALTVIAGLTTSDRGQGKLSVIGGFATWRCWEQLASDVGVVPSLYWEALRSDPAEEASRRVHTHSVFYEPAPTVVQPRLHGSRSRTCNSTYCDAAAPGCGRCRCEAHCHQVRLNSGCINEPLARIDAALSFTLL